MENGFPQLPVLNAVADRVRVDLRGVCLVAVQHLLETTGSLFEALIRAGCRADRIHVVGKLYSRNEDVVHRLRALGVSVYDNGNLFPWGEYDSQLTADCVAMWTQVEEALAEDESVERVIVLDEGGFAAATIPPYIKARFSPVVVEQTSSGLNADHVRRDAPPIVAVASSAAKTQIEPLIIQAAAFKRAFSAHNGQPHASVGVIGLGPIGRAISWALVGRGHAVCAFDSSADVMTDLPAMSRTPSIDELWCRSSVLWGCSGADALDGLDRSGPVHERELISCSSSDREFRSLLRLLNEDDRYRETSRLSDVHATFGSDHVVIRRGGFPINFDGSKESVPGADIQLTRGLLFAGIAQGTALREESGTIALDPALQRFVLSEWLRDNPARRGWYAGTLLQCFDDEDWILDQSAKGAHLPRTI